ncbi:MAG TPA: hypothetical protein VGD96_15480 [Bradyrhizobium sp.]
MAKNSDHLAGFEAEDTGGLFSSLLAEEDESDRRRTLWRVASWGVGAIAAVVIAVMANQSSLGWRREQAATSDLVQQANRLQAVARESQNEARRLASAVDTLNSDRDRLYTRVTVLEQGLDSVTGAIAKQTVAAAVPAPVQPDVQPAEQTPAPVIAPAATKPAAQSEKAAAAASVEPVPASTSAVKDVPTKPAAMPATPLIESKSMMAPPDPAAGKLIEPSTTASTVAAEPIPPVVAAALPSESAEQDTAETALPKIQRTEFGIDVGSANSIGGLRALWRGLLKSRSKAPLAALQPIIVIREGTGGRGMQLRLVAGPLSDAAAAAKLCAAISEKDRECETAVYDGQRLSFKAEDAPAAAKPAAPAVTRKRNAPQKRAAVEEPAKKPEAATSSGWTTFFGKKN